MRMLVLVLVVLVLVTLHGCQHRSTLFSRQPLRSRRNRWTSPILYLQLLRNGTPNSGAPHSNARAARRGAARDNVNSGSGNHHTHLVTKRGCPTRYCAAAQVRARPARAEPAARRPLAATEIRLEPEFSQRVCRDTHTHLVTTCRLPDHGITL